MARPRAVRLSFAPIASRHDGTHLELALRLGVQPRQVYRWLHTGLTAWDADRCATRMGFHPIALWGHLWADIVDADLDLRLIRDEVTS